jgi:hypothetical protein
MPLSAEFSVEGDDSVIAHEVAYAQTVDLALLSTSGARTIAWSIAGTSHSSMASPTITPAGSPTGATASFAMPADPADGEGRSVVVKCLLTDNSGATAVAYRVVGVPNNAGRVPFAVGEENYRNATHGWTEEMNALLATVGDDMTPPADPGDDGKIVVADGGDLTYSSSIPAAVIANSLPISLSPGNLLAATSVGDAVIAWGTTTGYIQIGDSSGITGIHHVATTEHGWYVGGNNEMVLGASSLTLQTNSIVLTAGALIFGASPATVGNVRNEHGDTILAGLVNAGGGVNASLVTWGEATDALFIGDAANVARVRLRALTALDFYVGATLELQVDAGGVYIPSNILTFGASPSSVGTIRSENEFSIGSETVGGTSVSLLRFASNNYLYFGGTANPSNIVGAVFTLDTSFQVDMGGNTELILTTSALTLATNNLVLTAGSQTITAGSLNVTAGVITQGSTVANSGSHRVGPSWSLVGVATDTSDTTLFSFGSNQIQIGTTNDLSEMNFHLASGAYRTFVASVEKFRVDTNAVYVYTRLEVGAAPADAGSIRLSNENSIQWAGSGGGAYSGLWLDSSETLQHGGSNVIGHTFDSDSTGVYSFMWEGSEQLELSYAAAVTTITSGGALVVRSASGENLTLYCPGDGVFEITKNDGATEVFSIRDDGSARFFGAVTGTVITSRPTWATGGSASSLALVLERWGLLEVTGD